jgi:hypothetical protein
MLTVVKINKDDSSVAEPHHFYAAPAPDKNFNASPWSGGFGSGCYPSVQQGKVKL